MQQSRLITKMSKENKNKKGNAAKDSTDIQNPLKE